MGDAGHVQLSSTETVSVPARTVHGSALRAVDHPGTRAGDPRRPAAGRADDSTTSAGPVQPLRVASVRRDTAPRDTAPRDTAPR
ncbi:hypothetical protein, partial [Goekera deserti]